MEQKISSKHNFMFWFHLLITSLAWVGPFLFSWQIMCVAFTIILLQFLVFDRCLLNKTHDLSHVEEDSTFYSYLLEEVGIKTNRKRLKVFVRKYLYFILGFFAYAWQELLGFKALLF